MKKSLRLMIPVLFAVMTGCSSPTEIDDSSDTIVGTWVWVESVQVWPTTRHYTPESEGYSRVLWFTADGRYSETHNDSTVRVTSYTVEEIDSRPALFRLSEQSSTYPFTISSDTLVINTTELDGPMEYFVRR